MNEAGSILNYSDIAWNIFDLRGGYRLNNILIDGGLSLGMQNGTSVMTDDDISMGGLIADIDGSLTTFTSTKVLSIGESSDGSLFGMHVGVGLTNRLAFGNTRITPSVGWRRLNYELRTSKNHGLMVTTGIDQNSCVNDEFGQLFCVPVIWGWSGSTANEPIGVTLLPPVSSGEGMGTWWAMPSGTSWISTGDTFSFFQPGHSHIYEVTWSGPFLALNFESDLNENNFVEGRVELGFPSYHAQGRQPYRFDWSQSPSVEDRAPIFGATHLGLSASWTTMLNRNWGISLGLNYDFYQVKGAEANTYLNGDFWTDILNVIYCGSNDFNNCTFPFGETTDGFFPDLMFENNDTAASIAALYSYCHGWTCRMQNEVNSFYRSVGIRLGITGRF
jgi:hypothetical protein